MKDLCELTGMTRQAIHFYIQQGLVPEGQKVSKNMAWYGPEHVERLQQIQRLQEERFLPLKVIRALLDGDTADLDPGRRTNLIEVGARLDATINTTPTMVDAADACARHGVPPADLARMAELGMIGTKDGQVSSDSMWLVEAWGQFRQLGFTAELGFVVDDLQMYEAAIGQVFQLESKLVIDRIGDQPPDKVAFMIERSLPLVHAALIHFHTAAVRNFFAALPRKDPTP
jgi:DNA-binding transcriptional MerR regulator